MLADLLLPRLQLELVLGNGFGKPRLPDEFEMPEQLPLTLVLPDLPQVGEVVLVDEAVPAGPFLLMFAALSDVLRTEQQLFESLLLQGRVRVVQRDVVGDAPDDRAAELLPRLAADAVVPHQLQDVSESEVTGAVRDADLVSRTDRRPEVQVEIRDVNERLVAHPERLDLRQTLTGPAEQVAFESVHFLLSK